MRRVFDLCRRAAQRVNVRIAILIVVVAVGGVAVWQGFLHMAGKKKPDGPTHQIATGVDTEPSLDPTIQRTSASLTDEELPGSSPGYPTSTFGQQPATRPPTNPYQAGADGPSGGEPAPANPYRQGSVGADSPYSQADQEPANQGAEAAVAAGEPAADPVTNYAERYGSGPAQSSEAAGYGAGDTAAEGDPTAGEPAAAEPATIAVQPSNSPPGGLEPNPYVNPYTSSATAELQSPAAQPLRSVGGAALGGGAAVAMAAAAGAKLAAPTPGERQLEGPQQPAIALEKFSPAEIQVGKPAVFEMLVRNTGAVPAQNVVISDHIPAGTQLIDVKPQPQQGSDGSLVWSLGTMQPGDEVAITLQVMPQTEGEIGSTAHVTFAAAATSRSICTRPQLTVEHTAPPKVLIGESITVGITVSNPGTGPATGVIIEEDVPEGLSHVAGAQLEYEVGTLRPGESKRLELSLKADKAGLIQNTIHVHGEGGLVNEHTVQVEVVAPQLAIEVDGPKRRFLERQATYTLSVGNPGTAPARDVELVAFLPRGMKFVDSDSQGQYDPAQHAVFWSLEELPPSKAGAVKLTTLPIEPGEQRLRIESRADLGLAAEGEQIVQVEQSAELVHSVNDLEEVIEVGSETTYEIHVQNTGTKAATNVRVAALLPPELQGLSGEGPTRAAGDPQKVVFEPLARLNPQEEVVFKVLVKGLKPGDHIVRVQLASDEWPTPVTREESTRVYEDR